MQLRSPSKAFGPSFWLAFTLLALLTVSIAALFWIFDHPFGTNWDEARYINNAFKDVANWREGGVFALAKGLIAADRTRPPAFRLLVLPLTLPLGVAPAGLRLFSLVGWVVTIGFVFLAARRIAGITAGAFAALFLIACPIVIGPHLRFYVDYPLYVAIAAFLYFLMTIWNQEKPSRRGWIGLGVAIGLGALAKPPIVFIVVPALGLTLLLKQFKFIAGPGVRPLLKATGIAIGLMLPWWGFNFAPAFKKAFRSSGYVRHSLGEKGTLSNLFDWVNMLVQSMLGPALALLTLLILVTLVVRLLQRQVTIALPQATAIAVCLAACLPMLLLSATGTNQNARLVAPALVPLAIVVGSLAAVTGWTTSRWLAAAAAVLLGFQLTVMVSPSSSDGTYQVGDAASQRLLWGNPTTVMRRMEQWDWFQLKTLCDQRNLQNPLITYLGNSIAFNVPQIARPWIQASAPVRINWMWDSSKSELDWNRLMSFATASDVVLTAPTLKGSTTDRQDVDNQYNAEFVDRLKADPRFAEPITLTLGRFKPTPVLVFLQKSGQVPTPIPAEMRTDPFQ